MKAFSILGIILTLMFGLWSCSSDEPARPPYHVKVVIEGNSDEHARVYGVHQGGQVGITISRYYETEFTLDSTYGQVLLYSDDRNTLFRIKIWVNGKLVCTKDGNGYIDAGDYIAAYKRL